MGSEASPRPPVLAACAAFTLGLALALAAWQWNHIFVDAVAGPLHLLGIPLAIAGAAAAGALMAKGLGAWQDGAITLAGVLGAGGVIVGLALQWFLPALLFGGH